MSLKIIGAGFGRTGTLSTYAALNKLGYPCYHMIEVMENKANKAHVDFWFQVANSPAGTQHNWEEVFANYTAAVDNPASCVWRELVAAHPSAKVILTLHAKGADAWYESTMTTIHKLSYMWQLKLMELLVPRMRKFGTMTRKLIWGRAHRGEMRDRAKAVAFYNQHIEEVRKLIPSDRLLIFSADQGWEPLCKFLGVPAPTDPFPNVNDRAEMQKRIMGLAAVGYGVLTVLALVVVGAIYGIAHVLG
jgi:hypothetical protein